MAYETEWLNVLEFDSVLRLVARYCDTEGGRNAVSKLSPHGTEYELRQTQKRLAETMELLTTTKFPGLSGYEPPRDIVRQCRISSVISPNVFRRLYDNLLKARKATQFVMSRSEKFRHVATMLSKLPDLSELERDIDNVIDKRDKIRDTASPEISRIRNRIRQLDEQIHSTLKSLARGQDIRRMLQFPEPTISGERYVLAVKSEHRSRFDGIAHYSSDSGQTTFMEPYAVVGKTNDLMREKSAEKAGKKAGLLAQLAKSVIRHSEQLDQYFVIIDRLDVLIGSARFGASFNGVVPDISFDMVLKLEEAKHPLLPGHHSP
ncbi:MAG: hypothetical protein U5N86_01265 [Planctomycetota bacterium]|nr:hypothetical protein [Planctomycetota bacterium]